MGPLEGCCGNFCDKPLIERRIANAVEAFDLLDRATIKGSPSTGLEMDNLRALISFLREKK